MSNDDRNWINEKEQNAYDKLIVGLSKKLAIREYIPIYIVLINILFVAYLLISSDMDVKKAIYYVNTNRTSLVKVIYFEVMAVLWMFFCWDSKKSNKKDKPDLKSLTMKEKAKYFIPSVAFLVVYIFVSILTEFKYKEYMSILLATFVVINFIVFIRKVNR